MLDPHLRVPLVPAPSRESPEVAARMTADFMIPDQHGVFTLRVDYRRPGWSYLEETTQVAVTPPRHDEYPRFIEGAYPFYTGAFSISIGFLVFSVVWISHRIKASAE